MNGEGEYVSPNDPPPQKMGFSLVELYSLSRGRTVCNIRLKVSL